MVGINTVEFFGAYLDAEIEKLQKSILSDAKMPSQHIQEPKKTAQIN